MLDLLAALDWGTVPAWFGGVSFLLALRIFAKDRKKSERAQVDELGVWPDLAEVPHDEEIGRYFLVVKNASNLPIRVTQIRTASFAIWVQDAPDQSSPGVEVQIARPELRPRIDTTMFGLIAPEEERRGEQLPHFGELRPGKEWRLPERKHLRVEVQQILIVDNANRRWELRPTRGGTARRIRWFHLLRERTRNPFHPWSNTFFSMLHYWYWNGFRGLSIRLFRKQRPWRSDPTMRITADD